MVGKALQGCEVAAHCLQSGSRERQLLSVCCFCGCCVYVLDGKSYQTNAWNNFPQPALYIWVFICLFYVF